MFWIICIFSFYHYYIPQCQQKNWTVQFIWRMKELIHRTQQEVSFIINVMKINAAGHKEEPYEDNCGL